ncbi:DUF2141 domain-containing protein [Fulvivirga sediminis]|uniref:DUF2141 domain-containing protein n=1 Tax=Fulvivirga sediminis TaxID=2803949 RepID=A0A937F726_9BACT|nr:DUF2141 domain-containing protein [Fulvivirga sediminis]MBL3657561.1 DUF2141 domain-containing protein [Fulvivirga sediminis]
MKTILFILALAVAVAAKAQDTFSLTVEVKGTFSNKGELKAALFNNSADYLKNPYKAIAINLETEENHSVVFEDLPAGEYAISVIHDANKNGKLDFGNMGPTEAYGFSNNPPSMYGPAEYAKAKLDLTQDLTITITIQ